MNESGRKKKSHVFISYVKENYEYVKRLCDQLSDYGINVWIDRNKIKAGLFWKDAIRQAIKKGDCFIACFSKEYTSRHKTYMNEELILAIDELRQRLYRGRWFIPVLLSKCKIPDIEIGAGRTLRDIQWIELYKNWDKGIRQIASSVLMSHIDLNDTHAKKIDISPDLISKSIGWDKKSLRIGLSCGLLIRRGNKVIFPKRFLSNLTKEIQNSMNKGIDSDLRDIFGNSAALAVLQSKDISKKVFLDDLDHFINIMREPLFKQLMPIATNAKIMELNNEGGININDDLINELNRMVLLIEKIGEIELSMLRSCVNLVEARLLIYEPNHIIYCHLIAIYTFFTLKTWGYVEKVSEVIKEHLREPNV